MNYYLDLSPNIINNNMKNKKEGRKEAVIHLT